MKYEVLERVTLDLSILVSAVFFNTTELFGQTSVAKITHIPWSIHGFQ
jgi:hypothetical protein